MKKLLIALTLLSPVLNSQGLYSQNQPPAGAGLPASAAGTLTRNATRFQDLETQLLQGLQDRNQQAIGQLLSDDFEVWSAEKAGPTSCEEWKQEWFALNLASFRLRDIAVREFGEIAVVSFLLNRKTASGGTTALSTLYVVDVWNQTTNKLSVRYVSTPAKPARASRRKE